VIDTFKYTSSNFFSFRKLCSYVYVHSWSCLWKWQKNLF